MTEFFSAIWNVLKAPVVLINFIALNWLGLLIGIGVALLIIFAIWLITKQQPNNVLCIVLILVLGICGMFVNNLFQTKNNGEIVSPEERLEDISANSSKYWGNTNGGFTIEQIKQAQKDNECPIHDDVNYTINMSDMGDFVCFWYRNGDIVENAIFIKTNNGLIYDGLLKYSCRIKNVTGILWWMNYDLNSGVEWRYYSDNYPKYITDKYKWGGTNLVVASDGELKYSEDKFSDFYQNREQAKWFTYDNAQDFIGKNTVKFISFDSAELIGVKDEAYRKINSYYTYLWNNYLKSKTKNIDVTDYMCVVIPDEERNNYPVSDEFKKNNPDIDYYAVYRCNISVDLAISNCGTINSTESSKHYIETNKDNEKSKVDEYDVKTDEYCRLYVELIDTINSDLSTLDLSIDKIVFNFKSDNFEKDLVFDSIEDLKSMRFITLLQNQTYTYTIYSNKVIFNSFSGTINVGLDNSKIIFEYKYLNNNTVVGVYLNPIGTIDTSLIDLSVDPVKVLISNENKTYMFDFDDNEKLNSKIYQLVEIGEYNFTILSTKLVFSQTTGILSITTDKNLMGFNYALNHNSSPLNFKVSILTSNATDDYNIKIHSNESNVLNIRDTLSGDKIYNVYLTLYSDDGTIIANFNHEHQSVGECNDFWKLSGVKEGSHFIAQLRFVDKDDNKITYLSDTVSFTYRLNTVYTFDYTATKN